MQEEPRFCANCNEELEKTYCSNCGQRFLSGKITLIFLLRDFISSILSLEKSGFLSLLKVITKPKLVIESYWDGWRNRFKSPGTFLFYALTICGINFAIGREVILGLTVSIDGISPQVFFLILFVPQLSLISYLCFYQSRKSYLKHLLADCYIFSAWIIVFLIFENLLFILAPDFDTFSFLFFLVAVFAAKVSVFIEKPKIWQYILYVLLQTLGLLLLALILLGLTYLANPELINFN